MKSNTSKGVATYFYLMIDVAMFNLAAFVSYAIPFYLNKGRFLFEKDLAAYHDMTTFLVLIPLLMFLGSSTNKISWFRITVEDFHHIFRAVFFADVFLYLAIYKLRYLNAGLGTKIDSWPTSTFVLILISSCLLICGWRLLLRFCVEKEMFSNSRVHRLIIVGLNAISEEVVQRISHNKNPQYHIVATFDDKNQRIENVRHYAHLKDFPEVLDSKVGDEVLFASAGMNGDELFEAVQHCEKRNIEYHILPSYIDLLASKSRVDLINFVPMISYSEPKIMGWNLFFKTLVDIIIALFVLVVLSPFWALVCVLIVLDSPGMPIFTQKRIGKGGVPFKIFKFRTMIKDAESMGELTTDEDHRITKVGRVLRRWSLDEIPQFLNVLLGQMSVMGPRAVVPYVAEKFDDWEKISLNVLPGITGLAQVLGRNKLSFYEKSFLSVYYIRNYSLLLDFKILMRTIGTVLSGVGSGGTLEAKRVVMKVVDEENS